MNNSTQQKGIVKRPVAFLFERVSTVCPATCTPQSGNYFWNDSPNLFKQVFSGANVTVFDMNAFCMNEYSGTSDFFCSKTLLYDVKL